MTHGSLPRTVTARELARHCNANRAVTASAPVTLAARIGDALQRPLCAPKAVTTRAPPGHPGRHFSRIQLSPRRSQTRRHITAA